MTVTGTVAVPFERYEQLLAAERELAGVRAGTHQIVPKDKLSEIAGALDQGLGDTDIDHFETDDEHKLIAPVQWACKEVNLLLAASENGQ